MNVVKYIQILKANFDITTATSLYDLIETGEPGFKERMKNSAINGSAIRVYVHSGTLGLRFDGVLPTSTSHIPVVEEQHLIENCDLTQIHLIGIDGTANATIQIGHI